MIVENNCVLTNISRQQHHRYVLREPPILKQIRNELLFQCNVIITRQKDTTVILYANIRIYEEYFARCTNRRRTHTSYRIVSDLNQHWGSRAGCGGGGCSMHY